jgi:hypothetical protein
MPGSQVPEVPTPSSPTDDASKDDFEKTLKGLYGNVDWSEAAKEYFRETGLI